ncbi:hypothetical protein TSH7_09970 [Azospirillum sp. TSH7]|uniref:hypothetical protein n=1 Tax=unclassified Azospirillum TaxID=2630922 RepID=UPI000D60B8F9|nr:MULTISPECIES: hypothetical protein [unclassified Azospirillum]PWC63995.1 hypothetical protein TSH20_19065 [Azospirillum sp. TSH20]PWC64858.1 hypothetical protein TSH7_09970 [Azospirillum sp. TSH7]
MSQLHEMLALFHDGAEQVPHSAVPSRLLVDARRAYLRSSREWIDQTLGELVRLGWIEPATGPRGGKAWRITPAGRTVVQDEAVAAKRRSAATKRRAARRREAERRSIAAGWANLADMPGLRIDGERVTVEVSTSEAWELTALARNLMMAAELIQQRVRLDAEERMASE